MCMIIKVFDYMSQKILSTPQAAETRPTLNQRLITIVLLLIVLVPKGILCVDLLS